MKRDYDHLFKIVLLGNSNAGKSSLLLRFADDAFTESYITTVGVDFRFKTVPVDQKMVKLQIWDTAGQERFRTITSAYYRGADGIALVYDITDRESFAQIDTWLAEVNKYVNERTCKVLIGNKCDLSSDRVISEEEARQKAEALGMQFIETSAKESTGVDSAFQIMCRELITKRAEISASGAKPRNGVGLTKDKAAGGQGGCSGCPGGK